MQQLSPTDAMFYNMDQPHNPMSLGLLWVCTAATGKASFTDIQAFLEDRISANPSFHRMLQKAPMELDYPYWVQDENIELPYHIKRRGLPQPGNWGQLTDLAIELNSVPMEHERPPWEIHIIDGLNQAQGIAKGSFSILIRFHHSYVDGKAFIALIDSLMTDAPEFKLDSGKVVVTGDNPSKTVLWAKTMPRLWGQSYKSMKASYKMAAKGWELAKRLRGESKPEQMRAPRTLFTAKISPHRCFDSVSWPLTELQAIRKLHEGASINDVVISIVSGGMRRYLDHHDDLPEESLISVCPVSIRPKHADADSGNHVSIMLIGMGSDIEDPTQRLASINARTGRGVPLAREVISDLADAADDIMPFYMRNMQSWAMDKFDFSSRFPGVNTVITNVPGAMGAAKYFAGAEIVGMHPLGPVLDGIGVTHCITSMGKHLTMGITSDRSLMGDMDFYMQCMRDSMQEYLQLAQGQATMPEQWRLKQEAENQAENVDVKQAVAES